MNLANLQTFVSIVEEGSLVRASERLNVTQSTVTARLKALETEIGQVLLHRDKSGVSLTPAGAKLLKYAQVISGLWRQARRETALPDGLEAVCTLGCHTGLWRSGGSDLLRLIEDRRPNMALSVLSGGEDDLDGWLADGLVDIVLTHRVNLRGGLTVYDLPPQKIALFGARPGMSPTGNPDYVFVDHGEEFLRAHGEAYHDAGTARIEFNDQALALDYILRAGGQAYFAADVVKAHVDEGRLFEVECAPRYARKRHLVVSDKAAANWGWLPAVVAALAQFRINQDT